MSVILFGPMAPELRSSLRETEEYRRPRRTTSSSQASAFVSVNMALAKAKSHGHTQHPGAGHVILWKRVGREGVYPTDQHV